MKNPITLFFALLIAASAAGQQNPFEGGTGTAADPFTITNAAQLAELAQKVNQGDAAYNNKHYKLLNDINLAEFGATFNDGQGWTPIGDDQNSFRGVFDGNGKTITGLYINQPGTDYIGLFGYIADGANIHSLGVEDVDIHGRGYVGGIAGYISNSSVSNSYVTGEVKNTTVPPHSTGSQIGGITGYLNSGSITKSYSAVTVNSNGGGVGGIAGVIQTGSSIINCYSTGEVSSSGVGVGSIYGTAGTQ